MLTHLLDQPGGTAAPFDDEPYGAAGTPLQPSATVRVLWDNFLATR
jgi:hypothetical protein